MVADPEIVRERCGRIRRYVKDLRDMSHITAEAFKQNRERQYAVLHALQLAIEACIATAIGRTTSDIRHPTSALLGQSLSGVLGPTPADRDSLRSFLTLATRQRMAEP